MNLVAHLEQAGIAHPPRWLAANLSYLTVTGSQAYGCSDDTSDLDVYGFCVPPREDVFPHLRGEIVGFGRHAPRFEQWQQHHMPTDGRQYDVVVFSIVKFFQLVMDNNPNMLDSLFTPDDCVLHTSPVAEMVRANRRLFLHRGAWAKFKGYALSQLSKLKNKQPEPGSKRAASIERHGYDVKYATHLCRLVLEGEQVIAEGDIDLRRHADFLRTIRRGEWSEQAVLDWFEVKGKELDVAARDTVAVPESPDEDAIKRLLLACLELHYAS